MTGKDTLTVIDNRTGKTYEISIENDAIRASDLGLNPANDGKLVRIPIPSLTEERRKELSRLVHKLSEEGRNSVRLIRRDANERLKKLFRDSTISEDDEKQGLVAGDQGEVFHGPADHRAQQVRVWPIRLEHGSRSAGSAQDVRRPRRTGARDAREQDSHRTHPVARWRATPAEAIMSCES